MLLRRITQATYERTLSVIRRNHEVHESPTVLYVKDGDIRTLRSDIPQGQRVYDDPKCRVVGTYNGSVHPTDLYDDLVYSRAHR